MYFDRVAKNLDFKNLGKKHLEFDNLIKIQKFWTKITKKCEIINYFYMLNNEISIKYKNCFIRITFFCIIWKFYYKNNFKVALQYHSMLLYYLRHFFSLNFSLKLKIDRKTCFLKTWKKFKKNLWQPYIKLKHKLFKN